jgi:hypothetical protein
MIRLVLPGMYLGKPRDFLKEIQSIHNLLSSKQGKPCHCCKTSIFNVMMTSASDLAQ